MRLTSRDSDLILAVYTYKYLSMGQVQRLYFPSEQTANRRVRLLADSGYIEDFRIPGLSDRLVALKRKGAELVAERLGVPQEKLGWRKRSTLPKDVYFARHFIGINDTRIALVHACARHNLKLLGFIPEYLANKTTRGGIRKHIRDTITGISTVGDKLTHTPDAVFALQHARKAALFFLEWDRGTESIDQVIGMAGWYAGYLVGEGYRRYEDEFNVSEPFEGFRAVIITSSEARLKNLRDAGSVIEPAEARPFLWVATVDCLADLLGPVWVSLDPDDTLHYSILVGGVDL